MHSIPTIPEEGSKGRAAEGHGPGNRQAKLLQLQRQQFTRNRGIHHEIEVEDTDLETAPTTDILTGGFKRQKCDLAQSGSEPTLSKRATLRTTNIPPSLNLLKKSSTLRVSKKSMAASSFMGTVGSPNILTSPDALRIQEVSTVRNIKEETGSTTRKYREQELHPSDLHIDEYRTPFREDPNRAHS